MKLEIFKVGKHTASNGTTKDYSLEDLNGIVANHSEPTPIVVGHPKTDSPAFGWIKSLFVKDDSLFAEASDIVPEFLELVKQKIYPNRSASFSTNEDGTLQLKHVGFLGGTLPAVKGLEAIQFSSDEELNTFEFALAVELNESEQGEAKTDDDPPKAKVADPNKKVSDFAEEIKTMKELVTNLSTQFSEVLKAKEDGSKKDSDFAEIQNKINELNVKLDAAYFQRNMQDKLDFSELTPAIRTKIEKLLAHFESLDFSSETQTEVISDFQELANLIQPFQTEEILKKVEFNKRSLSLSKSEFSEMNVDKDSLKLFNEATAYAKENEITFADAVTILSNNNSEV